MPVSHSTNQKPITQSSSQSWFNKPQFKSIKISKSKQKQQNYQCIQLKTNLLQLQTLHESVTSTNVIGTKLVAGSAVRWQANRTKLSKSTETSSLVISRFVTRWPSSIAVSSPNIGHRLMRAFSTEVMSQTDSVMGSREPVFPHRATETHLKPVFSRNSSKFLLAVSRISGKDK